MNYEDTGKNGIGSLELHHFGIMVKEIGVAARYYETSLGLEVRSGIVRDTLQGALVQFLAIPQGHVYLELISPDGPRSPLMNSLNRGTGLHHVCFSTRSLNDCLSSLRSKGALIVKEPATAAAFGNHRIAWVMDRTHTLIELVEEEGASELRAMCDRP